MALVLSIILLPTRARDGVQDKDDDMRRVTDAMVSFVCLNDY